MLHRSPHPRERGEEEEAAEEVQVVEATEVEELLLLLAPLLRLQAWASAEEA